MYTSEWLNKWGFNNCECESLRNIEQEKGYFPFYMGRCVACIVKTNEKVPRCFSCNTNPAPKNKEMCCRGCRRYTRKQFKSYEEEYQNACTDHINWLNSLSLNEMSALSSRESFGFDGASKLNSPRRKYVYPYYPEPVTNVDISQFIKNHPEFVETIIGINS